MSSALTSKRLNNSSVASPETATSVEQTMENEAAAFEVLWWASGRDDDSGGVCLNLQQRPPPRRPIGNIGCSDEVGHDVALWTTYGEGTGQVYR